MRAKDFIIEAQLSTDIGTPNDRRIWNLSSGEAKLLNSSTQQISETATHTIYKITKGPSDDGGDKATYYARRKNTGSKIVIDATLNATEIGDAIRIDTMATTPDSPLKMHIFLHHLITVLNKSVGSNHFSEGGKRVMERLKDMPGVLLTYFRDNVYVEPGDPYSDTWKTSDRDSVYIVAKPI